MLYHKNYLWLYYETFAWKEIQFSYMHSFSFLILRVASRSFHVLKAELVSHLTWRLFVRAGRHLFDGFIIAIVEWKKKTQQKDDKQLNNFGTNTGLNKNYLYLSQSKLGNFYVLEEMRENNPLYCLFRYKKEVQIRGDICLQAHGGMWNRTTELNS